MRALVRGVCLTNSCHIAFILFHVMFAFSTQLPCILDLIILLNLPGFTKSLWHLVNLLL